MKKKNLLSISFILLFVKFSTINAQVYVQDSLILVKFYNTTNGANWQRHSNWLTSAPVVTWEGIELTGNRVSGIYLWNNNINGILPSSFGNLSNLAALNLSGNYISGKIPPSFGNLANLEILILDGNEISGAIPSSFNKLNKLRLFSAISNNLSGKLNALESLNSLGYLSLSFNQIEGKIPTFKSTNFYYLEVNNNQLSGRIPVFRKLPSLSWIDFSNNQLIGSVSNQFDSLTNTSLGIFLSHNKINKLQSFNKRILLAGLDLSFNNLSGIVPALDSLKNLSYLNLSYNQYTFSGMEDLALKFSFADYSPQANIHINQNGNKLSVSAGGTLANNTYKWYKNGKLFKTIKGDSILRINNNGNYYVTINNSIATALTLNSDTITYQKTTNAVADVMKEYKPTVYPNPVRSAAIITFNATGNYTLKLQDISGKTLLTKTGTANKTLSSVTLEINDLPGGLYLVTIKDEKNTLQSVELIKQ